MLYVHHFKTAVNLNTLEGFSKPNPIFLDTNRTGILIKINKLIVNPSVEEAEGLINLFKGYNQLTNLTFADLKPKSLWENNPHTYKKENPDTLLLIGEEFGYHIVVSFNGHTSIYSIGDCEGLPMQYLNSVPASAIVDALTLMEN